MVQLRSWLRAAGVPIALMVGVNARERLPLLRRKDRWSLFLEIATALYRDQLPSALRHLQAARPLAMAIDVNVGKQMDVSIADG